MGSMVQSGLVALGLLFVGKVLLGLLGSLKSSRSDGDRLRLPPIRRLMLHIMPTRAESTVLVESFVDAGPLEDYLAEARPRLGANLTHVMVAAAGVALGANPRINRFSSNGRLYARRGRWVSFSMKRGLDAAGGIDRGAGLATVKFELPDGEDFGALCARINGDIRLQRSGKKTAADKEYDLFDLLPTAVLTWATAGVRWLDAANLLPAFFIRDDALFTSVFVANLGSLGMAGGYHHLFEYGNCPVFLVVGAVEEAPVAVEGRVELRRRIPLRFTYDERIEDAANARHVVAALHRVLAEPRRWLGCLDAEGADRVPLWPREDWASADGVYQRRD